MLIFHAKCPVKKSFFLKLTICFFIFSFGGFAGQTALPKVKALPPMTSADEWCRLLGKDLQSVDYSRCRDRRWIIDGKSTSGLPIPHLFWGATEGRRVMIVGGIHGDEISSVSLVFRWMDFLEKVRAESPLRKMKFIFCPLTNPDGFWSRPRTRTNILGVDLNRNFITKSWDKEAHQYWRMRTKSDPRRFPGAEAGSEQETKYIQQLVEVFKPEIIVSVHAPYGILDHDGPIIFPKNLRTPLPLKTLGAFPGSLGRYAGIDRKIPVITVELMMAKVLPDPKAIEDLFLFVLNSKESGVQSVIR